MRADAGVAGRAWREGRGRATRFLGLCRWCWRGRTRGWACLLPGGEAVGGGGGAGVEEGWVSLGCGAGGGWVGEEGSREAHVPAMVVGELAQTAWLRGWSGEVRAGRARLRVRGRRGGECEVSIRLERCKCVLFVR